MNSLEFMKILASSTYFDHFSVSKGDTANHEIQIVTKSLNICADVALAASPSREERNEHESIFYTESHKGKNQQEPFNKETF